MTTPFQPVTSHRSTLPAIALADLASELDSGLSSRIEPAESETVPVTGMTVDSREVVPGNLFVCKGAGFKPAFLSSAAAGGAAAYLCEDDPELVAELECAAPDLPRLVASDVRAAMAQAAPIIYGHPERDLDIVGITGTKGKSTAAYMLKSILSATGDEPSIMGSIDTDDGVEHFESHNTTPEAPELWRHLHNTVQAGRRHMVMEVSSQGLKYDRMLGVPLRIGAFLNIGRDHISGVEHPTFEDYLESKLKIFAQSDIALVNLATDHLDEVLAAAQASRALVTFSPEPDERACFQADHVISTGVGLEFDLLERIDLAEIDAQGSFGNSPSRKGEPVAEHIALGIPGLFNVENALAAIACARLLGVSYDAIKHGLAHLRVPGRMEVVATPDRRIIALIDYAHNELSYQALFSSVEQEYPGRRIIAVFGAPGGKAQERREALPRVAGAYADLIIYTEEDPAHERVEDICDELAAHTPAGVAYRIICDREQAVAAAFEDARAHDGESVVLLLAKGDETRQHRGDEYPEVKSDLALAREILAS